MDIFIDNLEGLDTLRSLCDNIRENANRIQSFHDEALSASGWRKGRKIRTALGQLDAEYQTMISSISELHSLIKKISIDYSNSLTELKHKLHKHYPYIRMESLDDFRILKDLTSQDIYRNRLFKLLHTKVFCFFRDDSIPISRLTTLMRALRDGKHYGSYFANVARFRKIFPTSMKPGLENENIFFSTLVFQIIGLFYLILIHSLEYMGERRIKARSQGESEGELLLSKEGSTYKIVTITPFTKASQLVYSYERHPEMMERVVTTLKKLATYHIDFEEKLFREEGVYNCLNYLTPGMVDMITVCKIRKIHNGEELDALQEISPIFIENNDFKEELPTLRNIWLKSIAVSARNVYLMAIFVRAYALVGVDRLQGLVKEGVTLSSSNLLDLETSLDRWQESGQILWDDFTANIRSKDKTRKVVLITMPKEDHNMAFGKFIGSVKIIPKDKFEVHLVYVSSAAQLAFVIKGINKKIDILVISAHGNWIGSFFSYATKDVPHTLMRPSLKLDYYKDIDKCFSKTSVCYMASCSTGNAGGVARAVAQIFKIPTYGPTIDTSSSIEFNSLGQLALRYGDDSQVNLWTPNGEGIKVKNDCTPIQSGLAA
jgi:hypothetical protein